MIKKHFLNRKVNSNSVLVPLGSSPVIALCFILLFCFSLAIPVKASSENTSLPYIVDNELEYPIEDFQSLYESFMTTNFGYDYQGLQWSSDVIVLKVIDGAYVYYYVHVPKSTFQGYTVNLNGVPYIDFDTSSNQLNISGDILQLIYVHNTSTNQFYYYGWNERGYNIQLLGNFNQLAYISNNILWGDVPVLQVRGQYVGAPVGSVIAPFGADAGQSDFLGSNADFGASVSQATMPTAPTYNTYNFTTFNPPSFDDSSVLDALQSIADILQYLASYLSQNITGAINNLGDNIQALGQYIADLLQYIARSIITNIQYGIQNLFENIQSLFEPLLNFITETIDSINQKLDYISQPYDANAVTTAFENTNVKNDIDSISQFCSTAFGVFDSVSEPNEFKIPLHLENIALLNISQVQYIDLGCINSVKTAIRAVMWCLTTFSLLYTIIDAIPSYISGGDE